MIGTVIDVNPALGLAKVVPTAIVPFTVVDDKEVMASGSIFPPDQVFVARSPRPLVVGETYSFAPQHGFAGELGEGAYQMVCTGYI